LERNHDADHWKTKNLDLSGLLTLPDEARYNPIHCIEKQGNKIDNVLDLELIAEAEKAITDKEPVVLERTIRIPTEPLAALGRLPGYTVGRSLTEPSNAGSGARPVRVSGLSCHPVLNCSLKGNRMIIWGRVYREEELLLSRQQEYCSMQIKTLS
jgi:hypothetical protein